MLKVNDENRRIQIRIQIWIRIRITGMDPRIRIRIHTKMSWIRNTADRQVSLLVKCQAACAAQPQPDRLCATCQA